MSLTYLTLSHSRVEALSGELAVALHRWYKRAFGKACSDITDPKRLLGKLRGRVLITRKQFVAAWRLYCCPDKLQTWNRDELVLLLQEAHEQASTYARRLSPQEQATIELLLSRGISAEKLSQRFGQPAAAIDPSNNRDARQVEDWIVSDGAKEVQHA